MSFSKHVAPFWLLGSLTLSAPAWADIPPPDYCQASEEGNVCQNAWVDDESAPMHGTCQKTTCRRSTPDGPMTYECHRCVADGAGSGGQANEAGSGNSAGTGESEGGNPAAGSASSAAGAASAAGTASSAGTNNSAGKPTQPEGRDESKDDGCSVSRAPGSADGLGGGLLLLGLAATGMFRRRARVS